MFMLSPCLDRLLANISAPTSEEQLENLVQTAISESKECSSAENRRNQWEFLLKNEVFRLAESEGSDDAYYEALRRRLDVILIFTEHDACDQTFPFTVLQDLLETQTIESCSHIFSWIEERSVRLTKGMTPQKGKALILLRTLNDLLRRLSKTGITTIFCGRILTFLSSVFPPDERSGVNLRGEYGPQWEGVTYKREEMVDKMDVDDGAEPAQAEEQKPSVGESAVEKKDVKQPRSPVATEEDKKEGEWCTVVEAFLARMLICLQSSTTRSGHCSCLSPGRLFSNRMTL